MSVSSDQAKKLFGIQVSCLGLVWLVILPLRAWSRVLTKRRQGRSWKQMPWAEDATMFSALIIYTVMASFALEGALYGGLGRHASEMSLDEASISSRAWFVCEVIFGPLSALVRTSIALLLFRLRPCRVQKQVLYACLTVMYFFDAAYLVVNLLQCSPPSYLWEQFRQVNLSGTCDGAHLLPPMAIAHSIVSATSDVVIAVLSAYATARNLMAFPTGAASRHVKPDSCSKFETMMTRWRRNKTKVVVIIFLGLGGASGIVMLVRIRYIRILDMTPDFLYRTVDVGIWSMLEPCVGMVAGSLPYIRPVLQRSDVTARPLTLVSKESIDHGIWVQTGFAVTTQSMEREEEIGTVVDMVCD